MKTTGGKTIMVSVIPDDFMYPDMPVICEFQSIKLPANIYTGTYPTIKINVDTMKDRTEDLKGLGIDGILTEEQWYNIEKEIKDDYGIHL